MNVPQTVVSLALAATLTVSARAEESRFESRNPFQETLNEREHLTGDWGGVRTNLVDRGFHFQFGYVGETFGNVAGGLTRGVVYEGLAEMALDLDFDKMTGWSGGRARVSGLWLHGRGPSRFSGDILAASNIDAHDSVRLYELWLEQEFAGGALSVRAGSLLADEEFAGTDSGGYLINSAFGWPAFISGNVINTGPAFYAAALGVRARYQPNERFYLQSGIYDGDSFDSSVGDPRVNESGTHFKLSSDQGAFIINELGFNWSTNARLPGYVKLGAWIHTADFPDTTRAGRDHDLNYGGYIAVEQLVWREAESEDQGLRVFARVGGSPDDRSTFAFVTDLGASYKGLFPGRDEDVLALGFIHADFSPEGRRYQAFENHEQVLELTYHAQIYPWWSIQPDLQFIHNPAGDTGPDDAFLIGLRSIISF